MDIWDQVYLYAYRGNQINQSTNIAENAACPRRQAVFLCKSGRPAACEGEIIMRKNSRDYSYMILLPSGEITTNDLNVTVKRQAA